MTEYAKQGDLRDLITDCMSHRVCPGEYEKALLMILQLFLSAPHSRVSDSQPPTKNTFTLDSRDVMSLRTVVPD
uniref:Uncharacterized protein n=1 Tax=Bursaphelenchus xylophilus TaxID=6326 RepID=A0A1I7RP78_BURXY